MTGHARTTALLATLLTALPLPAADGSPSMDSFNWISGCWGSVGGEAGSGEFWTTLAGDSLFGISRTVRDGRTVGHEFLQIRTLADGDIALIAQPSGQAATIFRLVSSEDRMAVFENPAHDFPQRIGYRRDDDEHLSAWIEGTASGQARRIDFPMTRADCL